MRTMLLVWLASLIAYPTVLSAIGAEPTATGTLTGRFLYDGEPQRLAAIDIPKTRRTLTDEEFESDDFKKYGGLGLKDETLLVSKAGGLKNALIWISDKKVPIPPLPPVRRLPAPATLTFHHGKLQPRVLVWWAKHRSLELLNKDESAINLRSDTVLGQSFNRLLQGKQSIMFELEPEPRPLLIRSDIYHWVQPAILSPAPIRTLRSPTMKGGSRSRICRPGNGSSPPGMNGPVG